MDHAATTVGWILARASVAYVFLYAACLNTRDASSREWTVNQTELILGFIPEFKRRRAAIICAILGMAMMYGGGISVLIGLEGRIGSFTLIVFSAMGMAIHRINRLQALPLATEIGVEAPQVRDKAQVLGWSAFGAHLAAGLKNISLIGVSGLFILDLGSPSTGPWAEPWIVSDLVGAWLR